MNITKYKNIIDSNYFQLSEQEKIKEIEKFAIDIYKDLGIPEKYYPQIIFTNRLGKFKPGAFSNKEIGIRKFFDFRHNGVIKLNSDIFLNGGFDRETDSIARLLYRTIHHEGIHCVQELIRKNRLDPNIHPEFLATKNDLKCANYRKALLSTPNVDGNESINMGLSYIKGGIHKSDVPFNTNFREAIYFGQLEEYDAFTLTDEKVIPFLNALCEAFPNENLTSIKNSQDKHFMYLTAKTDRLKDVLSAYGYNDIQLFVNDYSIVRRAIFLKNKGDIEKANTIIEEHQAFYYDYVKESKQAFKDWISLSKNFTLIDENATQQKDIKLDNDTSIINSGALEQAELLRLEEFVDKQLGEPPTEEEINDMINNQQYTDLENSIEVEEEEEDFEL